MDAVLEAHYHQHPNARRVHRHVRVVEQQLGDGQPAGPLVPASRKAPPQVTGGALIPLGTALIAGASLPYWHPNWMITGSSSRSPTMINSIYEVHLQ